MMALRDILRRLLISLGYEMNLFEYTLPPRGELFTTLLEHKNIKIMRIVSTDDFDAIEYVQEEDEWVVLLEGRATLQMRDKELTLTKGDTVWIPAKTPHKILDMDSGTLWLAVHIF